MIFGYKGHRISSFLFSTAVALLLLYYSLTGTLNYRTRNIFESFSSFLTGANKHADTIVKNLSSNVHTPQEIAQENSNLRKRIDELQFTITKLQYQNNEYIKLTQNLGITNKLTDVKALRVLSFNQATSTLVVDTNNAALINNQAVYSNYGVIGFVTSIADGQARINSYLNPNNMIHVLNLRNNQLYTLIGDYDNLKLNYFYPDSDLIIGDKLVTSGLDGVFIPNFTVGTVSQVSRDNNGSITGAVIKPPFTFNQLPFVLVELPKTIDSFTSPNNPSARAGSIKVDK